MALRMMIKKKTEGMMRNQVIVAMIIMIVMRMVIMLMNEYN